MKKSAIVDHPLWTRRKPTKKEKTDYFKQYGLVLTEIHEPKDAYFKMLEELLK